MKRSIIMLLTLATLSACADKIKIRDRKMRADAKAFIEENIRYHHSAVKLDSLQIGKVDSLTEKRALQLVAQTILGLIGSEKNSIAIENKGMATEQSLPKLLRHTSDSSKMANLVQRSGELRDDIVRKCEQHIQTYQRSLDSVDNIMNHADSVQPYALYTRVTYYLTENDKHFSLSAFFVVPYKGESKMFFDK